MFGFVSLACLVGVAAAAGPGGDGGPGMASGAAPPPAPGPFFFGGSGSSSGGATPFIGTADTPDAEKVAMVAQNFNADLMGDVNALATHYFECYSVASAYKTYFEQSSVALPCFEGLMHHYAKNCYSMATHLNSYLVHRGGKAKFPTVDLSQACKNIIKDPEAKLGRTSDTTARMCICEFMDDQTANFNTERTQACPARPLWKNGLLAAEDLTQMLKHLNGKLINVAKEAKTKDDADLAGWLEQPLHAMVKSIKATNDIVTLLDNTVAEKNYRMMENKFNTGHCMNREERSNLLQYNNGYGHPNHHHEASGRHHGQH